MDTTKIIIIAVCAVVAVIILCVVLSRRKKAIPALPDGFTVTAHTGSMGTKDNSYESLVAGYKNADIIEFDVKFDKDGIPVLAHTEVGKNPVTLEKTFAFIAERKSLSANIDMKDKTDDLIRVEILAKTYNVTDRVFFTGIGEKDIEAVRENCPSISYYLNVDVDKKQRKNKEYLLSLVEKVKECGAVGINFNKDSASKELVDIFRENGLLVSIWTVNKKKEMYKILSYAPDNITTRKPDVLNELIGKNK